MYFINHDLFNNAFLNSISVESAQIEESITYLRSIREWYRQASYDDETTLYLKLIRPILQNQSLDCLPLESNNNAYFLTSPWDKSEKLGLLFIAPPNEPLFSFEINGKLDKGKHWSIGAINLAREHNQKWVLLSNGHQWRLLNSQILHHYDSFFELNLDQITQSNDINNDFQKAIFFLKFILSLDHGFGKDDKTGQQFLDLFYEQSEKFSYKIEQYLKLVVTDDLGTSIGGDGIMAQLCYGFIRSIDPDQSRQFTEKERNAIFRDSTYLLYRLLFLFYAEARGLLPIKNNLYQKTSLQNLVNQARDILSAAPTFDLDGTELWNSLDHLFNLVDIGDIPLEIPAFDGGLFDNDGHEYLENQWIPNLYLAEALIQLAFLHDEEGNVIEPIDYKDLTVRHLGSLYEGMIEYRLYIAEEEMLARRAKDGTVQYLPASATKRKANDEALHIGSIYFAQTSRERKATGTHYTPEDLVGKLVNQTVIKELDHRWQSFDQTLITFLHEYNTLADERKKEALQHFIDHQLLDFVDKKILSLRICDPAMGSGHFLVYAAQAITNFIIWALSQTPWQNPDIELTPLLWRRRVVEQCLYGVDINPTAVELGKLSLWLATMQTDYPLSFLDHRLKVGNSLLGVSFDEIVNVLEESALNRKSEASKIAETRGQYAFSEPSSIDKATQKAVKSIRHILSLNGNTIEAIKVQKEDFRSAQEVLQAYRDVGDFLAAIKMGLKVDYLIQHKVAKVLELGQSAEDPNIHKILNEKENFLAEYQPFHWMLEFPDIFLSDEVKGFDVVIGNPPFMGGSNISANFGNSFLKFIKSNFDNSNSQTDLSAYFFRKAYELIKNLGLVGMVATNTIAQGDTRRTGLSYLLGNSGFIYFAERFVHWGGDASVEVNLIALQKQTKEGSWVHEGLIDGESVPMISSWLDDMAESEPINISQNEKLAMLGDSIKGIGFALNKEEAENLIRNNPKNQDCLFLFPNGRDINNDPESRPSRYVICFFDWPLEKAQEYPDLLQIAKERVKPQREKTRSDVPIQVRRKKYWWRFGSAAVDLYKAINGMDYVFVRTRVSEFHMVTRLSTNLRFSDSLVVFAYDDFYHFSILQSWIHETWLRRQASTMRTDIRYTPTDCFQTFPFPPDVEPSKQQIAEETGRDFYGYRQQVMLTRQLGLTNTYNLLHDPNCLEDDIVQLRDLQVKMDESVLACYGWNDIELDYNFYRNHRKKIRYMPSASAQRELFSRLLSLNHQIAAAEEEAKTEI